MNSLGLEISETDIRSKNLSVYPVPEPVFGEESGNMLTDLALDLDRVPSKYGLIVVDAITNLARTSQDNAIMGFFSNCKKMSSKGRTIVLVAHSSAFSADLRGRAASVCETFMELSTGKPRDRPMRKAELLKVDDIDLDRDNVVAFDVQPQLGMQIIPFSQAKA